MLSPDLERRIAAVAGNRESGASELLAEVIAVLREALSSHEAIVPIARAVCRAQPSMAPLWNAALAACEPDGAGRLERFAHRVERAPAAIARFAIECFSAELPSQLPNQELHLVTISFSSSVVRVCEALVRTRILRVSCSESRPALEGRRLAERLSALQIPVTVYSDAAIGHALVDADAVIVGADAVAPLWFLNKSGTRLLATSAWQRGIPVHVVASRDKFVAAAVAERLVVREEAASEIWADPPAGVTVRNPYFELIPLELVTTVISDLGLLGAAVIPDVCASMQTDVTLLDAVSD